ncbi:MAG: hypothetical protein ABFR90_04730 [Planctomycetota bacterium]
MEAQASRLRLRNNVTVLSGDSRRCAFANCAVNHHCTPTSQFWAIRPRSVMSTSPAAYERAGRSMAQQHADFYGGVWEVFMPTTHNAMSKQSSDLGGIKPPDLTRTAQTV